MHVQYRAAARVAAVLAALAASGCSSGGGSDPTPNRDPSAVDDVAVTERDEDVGIDVLANDTDPDGDPLVVTTATQPSHGTVQLVPGGLRYQPAPSFTGDDSFDYGVGDGRGGSATATVHVTVAVPNSPPAATPIALVNGTEDTATALVLTGTDAEDLAADLLVEVAVTPIFGTLSALSGDAPLVVTYTPPADYSGPDSFAFRVVDTAGARSQGVAVTIQVAAVNDVPVAAPLGPLVTDEDVPVALTLTGTDVEDPEHGLVVSLVAPPAHGDVGSFASPAPIVTAYLPDANFAGEDTFSYRVTDGDGDPSAVVTVSVTVNAVNDAPSAPARSLNATEDVAASIAVAGTDVESATTDLVVEIVAQPGHGAVSPGSGAAPLTVSYQPAANHAGADSFTYRVKDPDGGASEPALVSISVAAVNDPPLATPIDPVATDEEVPVGLVLTGADPDHATTALWILVAASPQHGTVTPSSGWAPLSVTYTPASGWSGSDGFTFRANDPLGALSDAVAVAIEVRTLPNAPVAADDAAVACPGASVRVPVLANDTDPDGDPLALTSVTQGAKGTVAISGAAAVYSAGSAGSGTDSFEYTVSDGTGRTARGTVTVTYSGPVITSLFPASGTTGGPLQLSGRCLGAAEGTVTIGGRAAEVSTWTPSYVVATVPVDFAPGSHAVVATTAAGPAASGSYEIVPWIGLVEPYYVASGEPQSVIGDAFVTPAGTVTYGGIAAQVDGWTNTAIQSRMPRESSFSLVATTSSGLSSNRYPVTAAGPKTWWIDRVADGRLRHSAVWTGTEMIVWGGENQGVAGGSGGGGVRFSSGARYDPRFDSWIPMGAFSPPSDRTRHTVVWTGKEMIVWGGYASGATQTGSRYDPVKELWTATATASAPSARERHTAVWTGSRMIVWGGLAGSTYHGTGGRYDPTSNTWVATATAGAPAPRADHVAVWTGSELIVWGGRDAGGVLATGARYDPESDRWTPIATSGAPAARRSAAAAWTGKELIVWGGNDGTGSLATGARYDPEADAWTPIATDGAPAARSLHTAVWTGEELIVWGGAGAAGKLASGGRYDPATDVWTATDLVTAPVARDEHTAVWTGAEMIVWGGGGALDTGGRYSPRTDTWIPTRVGAPGEPAGRRDHAWGCVGGDLVVWGGNALGRGVVADGARYDAATRSWTPLPALNAPSPREGATAVWTGSDLVVWGGRHVSPTGTITYLADGARWNPAADEWTALATSGAPAARSGHVAVWAGSRMIVWGGQNGTAVLQTGATYDPETDAWDPLPVDTSTPQARRLHAAVSTGTEMLVWGGETFTQTALSTGARFDVANRRWAPLQDSGLAARVGHSAVWTGTQMLVWGGYSSATGKTHADGAAFFTATASWSAMASDSLGRQNHVAVWSGAEMLVWGGNWAGAYRGTPYRYEPVGKVWTVGALSGNPLARDRPSACWTGTDLVVWGGSYNGYGMGALGHYRP
jgi:N-acetylneuraminic acid mutarotase